VRERRRKIAVIGSGFGGLGTAIRLAAKGYDVEIFEARDMLGGRAYVYRQDGFTFDAGPTVITAPFLFDELYEAAGRSKAADVKIVPVDPFYRIEFDNGKYFEYNADESETERRVTAFSPRDTEGYRRMIAATKDIFRKGFVELSAVPFLRFGDMVRIAPDLIRLQSHKTVYQFVSGYIEDPLLRQVFSFHPLLVGGNPFQTTSIYALIHHLEREWGVHYAMGGTGALVSALGRLFQSLGGKVRLNTPVRRILLKDGAASGVETEFGETVDADAVVSNADVANTYRKMLPDSARKRWTNERLRRMRYSMGLFVLYFGTKGQYPDVRHHTILLGPRYEGLLRDIFQNKVLAEDFSIYLHRPTATDPATAPPGHDCFYALVPVPNQLSGIDWRTQAKPFRDRVMSVIEKRCLPGLSERIVTERVFTPLDFETTLNTYLGSGFSFEPIFTQSAWFRPHNVSEDIDNLFFCGAGTHPGAGVPGVLSSAKIVEKLVCEMIPN
jgi:phytoene desaturase